MATDFLLAAIAATLAALLLARGEGGATVVWAGAFVFTAAAAIAGGVFHGYRGRLGERRANGLWRATLLLSAGAGFLLLVAAALGAGDASLRRALLAVAALKLAVACLLLWRTGRFAVIVQDAGLSLLLILALSGWRLASGDGGGAGWMAAGAVTAIGAGYVQRRERKFGEWLNHNDIFHFVEALACYLFYRGALYP